MALDVLESVLSSVTIFAWHVVILPIAVRRPSSHPRSARYMLEH